MCYLITDNQNYVQVCNDKACVTTDAMKATTWASREKATNYAITLPALLQRYEWHVESAKAAIMSYNVNATAVDDFAKELAHMVSRFEVKLSLLQKQLSIMDLERSDIEHFIEFNEFDEAKAMELCTQLNENARQRRQIKNEIAEIECLFAHGINSKNVNQLEDRLDSLHNRQYSARVLPDMFEN